MHRRRRTALVLSAAAIAAAPLLTACGSEAHPGAAAVVGGDRITVAQLEGRVSEVRDAQRAAVPDDAQYEQAIAKTGGLTRDTLHSMVLDKVLHRAATDAGVTRHPQGDPDDAQPASNSRPAAPRPWRRAGCSSTASPPTRLDESLRYRDRGPEARQKLGVGTTPAGPGRVLEGALQGVQEAGRRPEPALRHVGRGEEQPRRHEDAVGARRLGDGDAAAGAAGALSDRVTSERAELRST